jgi:hypothetical protein
MSPRRPLFNIFWQNDGSDGTTGYATTSPSGVIGLGTGVVGPAAVTADNPAGLGFSVNASDTAPAATGGGGPGSTAAVGGPASGPSTTASIDAMLGQRAALAQRGASGAGGGGGTGGGPATGLTGAVSTALSSLFGTPAQAGESASGQSLSNFTPGISSLNADTAYSFAIHALNTLGFSNPSNEQIAHMIGQLSGVSSAPFGDISVPSSVAGQPSTESPLADLTPEQRSSLIGQLAGLHGQVGYAGVGQGAPTGTTVATQTPMSVGPAPGGTSGAPSAPTPSGPTASTTAPTAPTSLTTSLNPSLSDLAQAFAGGGKVPQAGPSPMQSYMGV